MPATPSPVQDASATTLAAVIVLLDRREQRARAAYYALQQQLTSDKTSAMPAISAGDDVTLATMELRAAAARWSEAQEALATVRELAARAPTP